jgi:hypothetical protein
LHLFDSFYVFSLFLANFFFVILARFLFVFLVIIHITVVVAPALSSSSSWSLFLFPLRPSNLLLPTS